jgi:hypothetical protein
MFKTLTARSRLCYQPPLALLDGIIALQEHRLHAFLKLSGQAEAEAARAQAEQRVQQRLAGLPELLPSAAGLGERAEAIRNGFKTLAAEVAQDKLAAREAYDRHLQLLDLTRDLSAHVLAASGLLLDPEASNYFLIIAGFQEGTTVVDQLAQLHDLGFAVLRQKGASPLDLNQLAALKARLEDRQRFFSLNLELAQQRAGIVFSEDEAQRVGAARDGISRSIEAVTQTFLGMSPDWDRKPEDYSAQLRAAVEAQTTLTRTLSQRVVQALDERARLLTVFSASLTLGLTGLVGFLAWRLRVVLRAILLPMEMLAERSRHHRRDRRHRLPDQHPGAQRRRGSRARRRAGPRLCRGGQRGAQPGGRSAEAAREIKGLIDPGRAGHAAARIGAALQAAVGLRALVRPPPRP